MGLFFARGPQDSQKWPEPLPVTSQGLSDPRPPLPAWAEWKQPSLWLRQGTGCGPGLRGAWRGMPCPPGPLYGGHPLAGSWGAGRSHRPLPECHVSGERGRKAVAWEFTSPMWVRGTFENPPIANGPLKPHLVML